MAVKKIRVGELAKELGLTSQGCLLLAQSMGITVKNVSSSMEEPQADRVRRKAAREGLGKPVETNVLAQPKKNTKDRTSQTKKRTRWPLPAAYDDSLFDPQHWMASDDLKNMTVESAGPLGHSSIYQTGGFAVVAKAVVGGEIWAIRLLYKQQADLEERYQVIHARQLRGELLDVMVPVEYREDEIGVSGFTDRFPVILVKWVEGTVFNGFVEKACRSKNIEGLKRLQKAMSSLEKRMYELRMAHGDLSGDNMMVTTSGRELEIKLLDYDSLWLPEIESLKSAVGDGELQHPGVSKSSNGSIGVAADFVAFRMYDLGLRALIINPNLGIDSACYEHKFLATRDEFMKNSSDITRLMRQLDEKQFDDLVAVLKEPYDDLLVRYSELPSEEVSTEVEATIGEADNADVATFGQLWTLASLVELWQLSVGDIRKLASRAGVTNEELAQGISSATAEKMAGSPERASLLGSKTQRTQLDEDQNPSGPEARIWIRTIAEQLDVDLNFCIEIARHLGVEADTASTINEVEAEELRKIIAELVRNCDVELEVAVEGLFIGDIRKVRGSLTYDKHQWVVRKGGRWFVNSSTEEQLSQVYLKRSLQDGGKKLEIRTIADDLDIDLNFLVKFAGNVGIKRDSASSVDEAEGERLRGMIESMISDCTISLNEVVSKIEIGDERELRNKFTHGRDLWIVKRGGQWMVGPSTASKWARQYPPKKISPPISRLNQFREIELRNHVTMDYVLGVAKEILGPRHRENGALSVDEVAKIERRILVDRTQYPIDISEFIRVNGLQESAVLFSLRGQRTIRRSYGLRGAENVRSLLEETVKQAAKPSVRVSVLAKECGVSHFFAIQVIEDVVGIRGLKSDSEITELQKDLAIKRIIEDKNNYPVSLMMLAAQTGKSSGELFAQMRSGTHVWVTRSYGVFLSGESAELLKIWARSQRASQFPNNRSTGPSKKDDGSVAPLITAGAIGAQTGSTVAQVLSAAREVLGKEISPNRMFDFRERQKISQRLIEDKKFPYPLNELVRLGIDAKDLRQMLQKGVDHWIERPTGILIDAETRTRLQRELNLKKVKSRKSEKLSPGAIEKSNPFRVKLSDLQLEFGLGNVELRLLINDVCRSINAAIVPPSKLEISEWLAEHVRNRVKEDKERFPHRLEEIIKTTTVGMVRARKSALELSKQLGSPKDHIVERGYGIRVSEALAYALIQQSYESDINRQIPKKTFGDKVKHWLKSSQCDCKICRNNPI